MIHSLANIGQKKLLLVSAKRTKLLTPSICPIDQNTKLYGIQATNLSTITICSKRSVQWHIQAGSNKRPLNDTNDDTTKVVS